jgi:hypothetical protein
MTKLLATYIEDQDDVAAAQQDHLRHSVEVHPDTLAVIKELPCSSLGFVGPQPGLPRELEESLRSQSRGTGFARQIGNLVLLPQEGFPERPFQMLTEDNVVSVP